MFANAETSNQTSEKPPVVLSTVLKSVVPFAVFLVVYALLPRFAQQQHLTTLIYIGVSALLVIGLNLLMGYAGQVSLGHAAFFGIGAYVSAILTTRPIACPVIPGISAGLACLAGIALYMSVTRTIGWRLGVGVVAALAACVTGQLLPYTAFLTLAAYVFLLAVAASISGFYWWKGALCGASAGIFGWLCSGFLQSALSCNGVSPWLGMLAGILVTGIVAYLIGGQVLRLRGHYLAMATLGFGIIVEIVLRQWTDVTGGSSDGIFGIATFPAFQGSGRAILSGISGKELGPQLQYYYIVWGFVFIALLVASNIVNSRVGRAFRAVNGSETAAETLGVDTARYKVQVFVLSAIIASVAGSLHAHNAGVGYVNPGEFGFLVSIQLVVMVVVGGMASVWGALLGAGSIELLKNYLLEIEKADTHLFGMKLTGLDPIVFGAVLIVVMMVLPNGLVRGISDTVNTALRAIVKRRKMKAQN